MQVKTNEDKLVKISVMGEVASPVARTAYRITFDGRPVTLPGVGGITYNIRVGDLAAGWKADHVEPGVSIENKEDDARFKQMANTSLNILSCVGNEVKVVTNDAKGEKGIVTGKHGGIEHVMVDFSEEIMEKLIIGDKMMVKAYGVGLELVDYPEIKVMNIDPGLMSKFNFSESNGKLGIPVTHKVPARVMGSGLGADEVYTGDYDIQLFDEATNKEFGLDNLRFGDIVAILDTDHSFGRIYKKDAVSVGIVVHSDCVIAGHGPGVTTLFTSTSGMIEPVIDSNANLSSILKLR
ncbi:MAG: DUF4438 domain-containing protein [Candidatus Thorarchaeota archaeon]|nr:MAG: DUF4438 domain-containing protein [Candidatus Thorarchaeota archaeon]